LCLLCGNVHAQQPIEKKEHQAVAVHQWADEVAAQIEVTSGPDDVPATLLKQSLLRWSTSTSISGDIYGDCYIWTLDSRPVAFLSVYDVIRDVNRCLELQSLSPQLLAAKANDVTFWTLEKPGLQWADLDVTANNLTTAEAAQRRLRTISSSFEGQIGEVNDTQKLRQLRLMSQPPTKANKAPTVALESDSYL
jgi:hypothetical protein